MVRSSVPSDPLHAVAQFPLLGPSTSARLRANGATIRPVTPRPAPLACAGADHVSRRKASASVQPAHRQAHARGVS